MNFQTSVKTCFKKYATFDGRASRSEFWYFYLFIAVGVYGFILLALEIPFFFAPGIIFSFLILVPAFAVTARRLHDTGRSGWWQLTAYIPYIGIIASIILIVVFCTPGEKKTNKFGKPIKLKH